MNAPDQMVKDIGLDGPRGGDRASGRQYRSAFLIQHMRAVIDRRCMAVVETIPAHSIRNPPSEDDLVLAYRQVDLVLSFARALACLSARVDTFHRVDRGARPTCPKGSSG
jgi:hypothetical protein